MVKSKSFILMQITERANKLGHDGVQYAKEVESKTVYELLMIKKDLASQPIPETPDVTPHHWLRGNFRFEE